MDSFEHFEVWIGAGEKSPGSGKPLLYPVRITDSPAGAADGSLALKITAPAFRSRQSIVTGTGIDLQARKDFGASLYNALFQGKVRDAWLESRGRIDGGQAPGLHLRLWIGDPELAALPWELLYDPAGDVFLATSSNMALSRYLPVPEPPYYAVQKPIKILLAVASPTTLPTVPPGEIQALQTVLAGLGPDIQFQTLMNATKASLQQALQQEFHVFHFLGHGDPNKLILNGTGGQPAEFIDDVDFAQLFAGRSSLRLAVLTACSSGAGQSQNPFSGVAPALVQKRLPAVVAMQYPTVQADTAGRFSQAFYTALGSGLPVDAAVNQGRQMLAAGPLLATRDWSTPVLYMGTRSGIALSLVRSQVSESENAWRSIAAVVDATQAAASLTQLTTRFRQISTLQAQLDELSELEDRLSMLNLAYGPCREVVARAGGDPARLNGSRFKTAWTVFENNSLPAIKVFLTDRPALAQAAGLDTLDASTGAIKNALQMIALRPLLEGAEALGALLVEAESRIHESSRGTLKRLAEQIQNTLGWIDKDQS